MEDTHFMERLERVGWRETELALRLYREPELVRLLLHEVAAPEAPRIAIALSDAPEPPHVIVARDGAFVTCLGAGMTVGDLPRVGRQRIERAADEHERLKGLSAYLEWANDHVDSVQRLWKCVLEGGHLVPREVIVALAPLVPLLAGDLIRCWAAEDKRCRDLVHDNTNRFARRREKLGARDIDVLGEIWRRHWAVGHLVGLFGMAERSVLDAFAASFEGRFTVPFLGAMRFGFWPTTLRGAWSAARVGQGALRPCKAWLREREAGALNASFAATWNILFVGAAHGNLRAEAEKALACASLEATAEPRARAARLYRNIMSRGLNRGICDVDRAGALVSDFVEEFADDDTAQQSPEWLRAYARWHLCNINWNAYKPGEDNTLVFHLMSASWFARRELFDFYPPEHLVAGLPRWTPSESIQLIQDTTNIGAALARAPKKKAPEPGRNDPCNCNSGKKYKRCCGA